MNHGQVGWISDSAIRQPIYGVNTVDNFAKTVFSPVIALNSRHGGNDENLNHIQRRQLDGVLRPCLDPEEDKLTIYRLFKANAKIDLAFATDDELLFI